ncbi:MAG: prepilin-type N-terminal cleavage/methylation domain-containing protein [Ilumatobacteraceae bacterium]
MKNLPIHRDEDKGFTLIELMVVVLIIAILLAIAIPTFLGAQNKAKDRSAQSSARNALTNAKTIFADTGVYTGVTAILLQASEPSLTFIQAVAASDSSTGPKSVSMKTTDTAWYGAVLSDTSTCFYIVDSVGPTGTAGTQYAKVENSSKTTCVASATLPGTPAATYIDKW